MSNKQTFLLDFTLTVQMEFYSHSAIDAYNQAMSVCEQPYAMLRLSGQSVKLIDIKLKEDE